MEQISGKVPRGFTRYYVLYLLTERSMTGKEIIVEAEKRSEGAWSPSPGLIYPLLGRLVRDELIVELDDGGFEITAKGEEALQKYSKLQERLESQYRLVSKLGMKIFSTGRLLADEALDRITYVTSMARNKMAQRSRDAQERFEEMYEEFLVAELERIQREKDESALEKAST